VGAEAPSVLGDHEVSFWVGSLLASSSAGGAPTESLPHLARPPSSPTGRDPNRANLPAATPGATGPDA